MWETPDFQFWSRTNIKSKATQEIALVTNKNQLLRLPNDVATLYDIKVLQLNINIIKVGSNGRTTSVCTLLFVLIPSGSPFSSIHLMFRKATIACHHSVPRKRHGGLK